MIIHGPFMAILVNISCRVLIHSFVFRLKRVPLMVRLVDETDSPVL